LVLLLVSVIGFFVSLFLIPLVFDEFDAYGEVPIPGTRTLHLPAEDVTISFHSVYPKGDMDKCIPIPEGLKVTITPPKGVAEPTTAGTDLVCDNDTDTDDERRTVQVARIPQVGDYTITTSGNVTEFASPRVAFGHPSRFGFLPWLFAGLGVVSLAAFFVVHMHWGTRLARTASADWPPFFLHRYRGEVERAPASNGRRATSAKLGRDRRLGRGVLPRGYSARDEDAGRLPGVLACAAFLVREGPSADLQERRVESPRPRQRLHRRDDLFHRSRQERPSGNHRGRRPSRRRIAAAQQSISPPMSEPLRKRWQVLGKTGVAVSPSVSLVITSDLD
jgi:hypothetical protein